MYEVGQMIEGYILGDITFDDQGYILDTADYVKVVGSFVSRTEDDEEYIQDIILQLADGSIVYVDEQDARPYIT